MELTDELGYRALYYLAAMERQRYAPTVTELTEYATNPHRRGGQVQLALQSRFTRGILGSLYTTTPRESLADWLARLRWIEVGAGGRVYLTDAGRAAYRIVEEEVSPADELPVEVILTDDPLSYPTLIGLIAEAGEGTAIVDPYFSVEPLPDIVLHTKVTRILTSDRKQGLEVALAAALPRFTIERDLEVRSSRRFHDRFLIPPHGPVRLIGTSLNSVGRSTSMTLEIRDNAEAIREQFEEEWARARCVGRAAPEMSAAQLAQTLGLDVKVLRRLVAQNELMPDRAKGTPYRFSAQDAVRIEAHPAVQRAITKRPSDTT
ncbi:MAG: hypothetical protein ICV64_06020 [Thermoleophilia bacterium]|nr:hypothetical protein [Thermoleophilia bacterium]